MRKITVIILVTYMLSGILTMMNDPRGDDSGSLFGDDNTVPETGTNYNADGFNDVDSAFASVTSVDTVESGEDSFSLWESASLIGKMMKFVGSVMVNAHLSYFMLAEIGVPGGLALFINAIIGLIQSIGYVMIARGINE